MSGGTSIWTVRLTDAAAEDFKSIVRWSRGRFGERQARVYAATLTLALREFSSGPDQLGVKVRSDIAKGLLTLHVARHGRKGSHFVMFRVAAEPGRVLEVLRLLHETMDFPRHLPPS